MKLFTRKKNLIKTNPGEKPSVRLEKVLFHHLQPEGFKYLKSKNEFTQDFEYGKRGISLSYVNSFGYISTVQYVAYIVFSDLERAFKKVYPKYGWTSWTILANFHWTESWLCDKKTGEYTDTTINQVANEFLDEIKPKIDRLFSGLENYEQLHQTYNKKPDHFIDYLPSNRLEKRVINGLLLIKKCENERYEQVKAGYMALIDKYGGYDKDDLRNEILAGIEVLEQHNIKIS